MFFVAFRYDYFGLPGIQKQNIADNKAQPANMQVVPTLINNPAAATQANSQPAQDQKNPQPPPRQAVSKAEPEYTKTMVKMKVKQGESFIQLTKDFYGRTDKELLSFIKSKNPQIQDVHKLRQGSVVYFLLSPKFLNLLRNFYKLFPTARDPTLFTFIRLENRLSSELGLKVDLVMKGALKPAIGRHILREVMPV